MPSAQTVWGNSVAILTGDLLFARASQLMARLGERAIRMQADTFERLVLGQLHETVGPTDGEDPIAHYIQVLADKTGSLIAAAAQSGVVFSGADPAFEKPIVEFGEKIGVAFQLIDDVIDLSPQPEETGKVPGTDLRAGVVTLPLLRLRRAGEDGCRVRRPARPHRARRGRHRDDRRPGRPARHEHHGFAHRAVEGRRSTRSSPSCASTRPRALRSLRRTAGRARPSTALAPLPEGSVKKALTRFAETIVERQS